MRRATVLQRDYWRPSRRHGGSLTTEIQVLHNYNDKNLEAKLAELNTGIRKCFWVIRGDYKLSRKSDQRDYFKYCIDCYFQPFSYDSDSAQVGRKLVDSLRDEIPGLK